MKKQYTSKVKYKTIDGKLCIEHYILLQELTFRKKSTTGEYKTYNSYLIKLPAAVYNLLDTREVYLEKVNEEILILDTPTDNTRKVRIQEDKRSINDVQKNRYSFTIPKKMLNLETYKRGESYITLRIIAQDNNKGYALTLEQDLKK